MSIAEFTSLHALCPHVADTTRDEAAERIARSAADLAAGRTVVLFDPAVGEAVLVVAAEFATTAALAFMIRHTSGFVKVTVPEEDRLRLQLPSMWALPGSRARCELTVTVDAAEGIGTGISAADRAYTIRTIADVTAGPASLTRPGHVAPVALGSNEIGTTGAVARIMARAGLRPLAAMCELVSPVDETAMAGESDSIAFARAHSLAFVSAFDLAVF
ncbi:3,4-dihydroxy-2-butanone-4-phosphate synthase [Rhodococcus zopfii]|uniref:3,4-dihydroxy-2-butanone-4-phosphate synthase n=1 Tax=Rhodococcus zopfii TaxID=43772 RepID=A0ABU3WT03_9NOCA|nr:3,4-dihydroxy-2-butanone-4-phosphate synthase [Rhodococcus zopfii]